MDWKELFKLNKLKICIIAVAFILAFFTNITALFEPCNWRYVCPDFIRTDIISIYPNFYAPAGTYCGFACIYYEARWSLIGIAFDIIIWALYSFIILFIIKKLQNKKIIKSQP